jgi:hypothetical protein
MGRPSKLTSELQASMVKMLRAGVHPETACKVEGLALSTYYDWRKRGEEGEEPYAEFLFETTRATALVIGQLEHEVIKAAQRDWRAGAFMLSKRARDIYGNETKHVELTHVTAPAAFRPLSDEAAEQICRKILGGERESRQQQGGETFPESP